MAGVVRRRPQANLSFRKASPKNFAVKKSTLRSRSRGRTVVRKLTTISFSLWADSTTWATSATWFSKLNRQLEHEQRQQRRQMRRAHGRRELGTPPRLLKKPGAARISTRNLRATQRVLDEQIVRQLNFLRQNSDATTIKAERTLHPWKRSPKTKIFATRTRLRRRNHVDGGPVERSAPRSFAN